MGANTSLPPPTRMQINTKSREPSGSKRHPLLRLPPQPFSAPVSEWWSPGCSQQCGRASLTCSQTQRFASSRAQMPALLDQRPVSVCGLIREITHGFSVNIKIVNKGPHLGMFILEYWPNVSDRTSLSCHCSTSHFQTKYLTVVQNSLVTAWQCDSPTASAAFQTLTLPVLGDLDQINYGKLMSLHHCRSDIVQWIHWRG